MNEISMLGLRRQARALVQEAQEALDEIVLPAILCDRLGDASEQSLKEIAAGKRTDLRLPRFLAISGKGGPGHEEWSNVTLFDHATSVGMAAAHFVALDLLAAEVETETLRASVATALAVGLLHDIDKLLEKDWKEVTAEEACAIFHRYRIGPFLDRFGVTLTPEQFTALISYDEVRTTFRLPAPRIPDYLANIVRRHVRLADKLDSLWLHGLPSETAKTVLEAWAKALRKDASFFHPEAFSDYAPMVIFDPHHPFILAKLADALEHTCETMTGMRPLFHAVRDETLVSLLPAEQAEAIKAAAIEEVAQAIPFDSEILFSAVGIPKISGARPDWAILQALVRKGIPTGDVRRLLAVNMADLEAHEAELRRLAVAAGCPVVSTEKLPGGKTLPLIRMPQEDEAEFAAVRQACLVSLAVGVEEATPDKALSRKAREESLARLLGDLPETLASFGDLTRRTSLTLLATARMEQDSAFAAELEALMETWFGEQGVFATLPDKTTPVRQAVRQRLQAMAAGEVVEAPAASQHCLITGEPVLGHPVEGKDGLYGIKSSALSYREGRAEQKFREQAEVYLSPISYAEYRMRAASFARIKGGEDGIPLRLSSPTAGGIFSLTVKEMNDRDFGLFDMVRADRTRLTYDGLESYYGRTQLGRFEQMPNRFADRITFLRIAMEAAQRYGRPLHLFSGLPYPRRDFFHCDCIDPELRALLGGDSFRLEELPKAIGLLKLVGLIAGVRKEGGLGLVDAAKSFCLPHSRFAAACLAWATARDRAPEAGKPGRMDVSSQTLVTLNDHIANEVARMDQDKSIAPPVELGRKACRIQRRPGWDASANDESFLLRTAIEAATDAYRQGWRDREGLIAAVAGRIAVDGENRKKGEFYSSAAHREPGQRIDDAIQDFAETFVDRAWNGAFKGRPPSSGELRTFQAAYRWAFTRSAVKDAKADLPAA
ncbi:hypothetical protein [Telmatospirillum sp. J64-1]|uniref:hypothetical protein n=1 Tax=Telmatospirillum sp. J64-1 TaxID=2502183 RepID=UPI00115EB4CE|nr:hypothetical protein [Telmatospirillum sp. J64-1]